MITHIWDVALYKPLVNILAFIVSVVPGGDVGVAVIILTLIVKTFLFPLSQRSIDNQAKMNLLNPELQKIKNSKASKEEQAQQTLELYKKHKTNPFSGCFLVLIQIPIIFALYYVFLKGLKFDSSYLYSFTPVPQNINMNFLGILDLGSKSLILAILAGITQFFQAYFMPKPSTQSGASSFQDSFAKSMNVQMKYVFPIIVAFIAYSISGAVALYWVTNNLFAIGQQLYSNKKRKLTPISKQ
ncbi:MAG TPA: YidC/Oxa1 family membrane protein insertase [Candidatus Paceibacterota bacterium]|nr:YidC/Oxa1 family membrane protein insertase [Candidatus Paceibacterota bacterium]HPT18005.1 YidC/Oxa1 family membrane protein insertase [Candidatus Paceibacterota bacterium]